MPFLALLSSSSLSTSQLKVEGAQKFISSQEKSSSGEKKNAGGRSETDFFSSSPLLYPSVCWPPSEGCPKAPRQVSSLRSTEESEAMMDRLEQKLRYLLREAFVAAGILERDHQAAMDRVVHHQHREGRREGEEVKVVKKLKGSHAQRALVSCVPSDAVPSPFTQSVERFAASFYAFEKEKKGTTGSKTTRETSTKRNNKENPIETKVHARGEDGAA